MTFKYLCIYFRQDLFVYEGKVYDNERVEKNYELWVMSYESSYEMLGSDPGDKF